MNLRTEARGKPCMVRLPGCTGGGDADGTVVLAHYRLAGYCGTGIKPPDEMAAWACAHCHDVVDGRSAIPMSMVLRQPTKPEIRLAHAEGVLRTIAERIKSQPAPKPKKRKTPFNAFDAEPKGASVSRSTHKAALGYITGIRS